MKQEEKEMIPQNDVKVYVSVVAKHQADGSIMPLMITWPDDNAEEHEFSVDKLLGVCEAVPERAGGHGIRYHIKIGRKETYLFYELVSQKWFVERK